MQNFLAIFKPKHQRQQDLKERVLKNKEGVLDTLSENIKGARACPILLGQKCLGSFCEFFMEFKTINNDTGKEFRYRRCAYVQTPLLLIELAQEIRNLQKLLQGGKNEKLD